MQCLPNALSSPLYPHYGQTLVQCNVCRMHSGTHCQRGGPSLLTMVIGWKPEHWETMPKGRYTGSNPASFFFSLLCWPVQAPWRHWAHCPVCTPPAAHAPRFSASLLRRPSPHFGMAETHPHMLRGILLLPPMFSATARPSSFLGAALYSSIPPQTMGGTLKMSLRMRPWPSGQNQQTFSVLQWRRRRHIISTLPPLNCLFRSIIYTTAAFSKELGDTPVLFSFFRVIRGQYLLTFH